MTDHERDGAEEGAPLEDHTQRHSSRTKRVSLVGALALVVIVAVVVAVRYRPAETAVRRASDEHAAPNFVVPDVRDADETIDIEKFRGRPVVLNFWASWCVPCRKEMPAFQAVYKRTRSQVTFLGMNHQDSRDDALDFLRDTGSQYPSGFDPRGEVARSYKLYGMPTTVFISAEGQILATRTGELTEKALLESLEELFGITLR